MDEIVASRVPLVVTSEESFELSRLRVVPREVAEEEARESRASPRDVVDVPPGLHFESHTLSRRANDVRRQQGCLQAEDLRAWMHSWRLTPEQASGILGISKTHLGRLVVRDPYYLTAGLSYRLEHVRWRDRQEVFAEKLGAGRPSEVEIGQVYLEVEVEPRWRERQAYCYGLDPRELLYFRYWSPKQMRHHMLAKKARLGGLPSEDAQQELWSLERFPLDRTAACCIVHKPSHTQVRCGEWPSFWKNRAHAEAKLALEVAVWRRRKIVEDALVECGAPLLPESEEAAEKDLAELVKRLVPSPESERL